jgi:hypothetical protein
VSPRDIAELLRHTALMRVVDGGADYEYCVVGDEHVVAHGFSIQGRCLSAMDEYAPGYGKVLKSLSDPVVRTRAPFALRGWIARGEEDPDYLHSENVFRLSAPTTRRSIMC